MNKWLRRALLGGVAMTVMAAGAQADELSALKAQLEALQARVATIESRGAALPEGVSLITFERGSSALLNHELFDNKLLDRTPDSRGVTIAITPTADLPAPTTSIELSGYVRAVALWHSTDFNSAGVPAPGADLRDFDIWARGQINVAMATDTAVGRITGGIQLRGNMGYNSGARANTYTPSTEMRTAWATWQMTDALSLTFGQTGQIATLSNVSYATIATPVGLDNSRRPQFRLTYNSGPVNFRFGIEDPSQADMNITWPQTTSMPDIAASLGFNAGMFGFRAGAEVGKVANSIGTRRKTGWLANAGINMDLGSMARVGIGGAYTKGLACDSLVTAGSGVGMAFAPGLSCYNGGNLGVNLMKAWALQSNLTFNMTENVTMLLSTGYLKTKNGLPADLRSAWSVNGALAWRPVEALQFGVEGGYYRYKDYAGMKYKSALVGFAGWFFF